MNSNLHAQRRPWLFLAPFALVLLTATAEAKLKILTTLPDLAFAAAAIVGDQGEVDSLLSGSENPHFVDARPDFIRRVSDADVVCAVGLQLEAGWLPRVLQKSGNSKVQPGGAGFCELGQSVTLLQVQSQGVDRSMGDLHPQGNPHFWISPLALAESTAGLVKILSQLDPSSAPTFAKNATAFKKQMRDLVESLKPGLKAAVQSAKKATDKEPQVIEYHREFAYLFEAYGLTSAGSIEEKPGVPPSAARLGTVALQAKDSGVRFAIAAPYAPLSLIHKFSEVSSIPHAILPTSSKRSEKFNYEATHRAVVQLLLQGFHGQLAHP